MKEGQLYTTNKTFILILKQTTLGFLIYEQCLNLPVLSNDILTTFIEFEWIASCCKGGEFLNATDSYILTRSNGYLGTFDNEKIFEKLKERAVKQYAK